MPRKNRLRFFTSPIDWEIFFTVMSKDREPLMNQTSQRGGWQQAVLYNLHAGFLNEFGQ
jgi:hypothetical protein